ncbi:MULTISPECIES: hypothetical protein [Streptomyces]|uniref:hypothetical protein n=1 Tax=Streptomyces TaxID=1883 RepID=UPI001487DF66|nr:MULTISPECIES: hypothetical protein [Streptomyces]
MIGYTTKRDAIQMHCMSPGNGLQAATRDQGPEWLWTVFCRPKQLLLELQWVGQAPSTGRERIDQANYMVAPTSNDRIIPPGNQCDLGSSGELDVVFRLDPLRRPHVDEPRRAIGQQKIVRDVFDTAFDASEAQTERLSKSLHQRTREVRCQKEEFLLETLEAMVPLGTDQISEAGAMPLIGTPTEAADRNTREQVDLAQVSDGTADQRPPEAPGRSPSGTPVGRHDQLTDRISRNGMHTGEIVQCRCVRPGDISARWANWRVIEQRGLGSHVSALHAESAMGGRRSS